MSSASLITKAYQLTNKKGKISPANARKFIKFCNKNKGEDFLTPIEFYQDMLDDLDPAMFPFMTKEKKHAILRHLRVANLMFLAQKNLELSMQKAENASDYDSKILQCQKLIDRLGYSEYCRAKKIIESPEAGLSADGKPVAYLGFSFGQWFAKLMAAFCKWKDETIADYRRRSTKFIREMMGAVNEKRLYWVWASSFLKTMLSLLPNDFFNTLDAKSAVSSPDPYTGVMSWGLYYFRFALNLSLLAKHTISNPWMSEEEKAIPWRKRLAAQWDMRKFSLLNDVVWATGNLLCNRWLVGSGLAGTVGDVVTLVLLVFDIALTIWEFEEQKHKHNRLIFNYNLHIKMLEKKIDSLKASAEIDKNKEKLIALNIQLEAELRAKNKAERDWQYKKMQLITNITYAVGLMLAFAALTAPFLPLSAGIIATMGVVGAVLCLAFTIISDAIKAGIDIHQTRMTKKEIKADLQTKIAEFKELLAATPDPDEPAKKLLFLEIKKLTNESAYLQQKLTHQSISLVRDILIKSIVPPLIFASFVFLPLGAGIGILAAGIALAILTHSLINKFFAPEKQELSPFNKKEYQEFCKDPDAFLESKPNKLGFFDQKEQDDSAVGKKEDFSSENLNKSV